MNEYEGIEYHADDLYGAWHAAIDVKVYARIDLDDDTEVFGETAWESVREGFWEHAQDMAHDAGYSGVLSEGRSGGWLLPYYQRGMATEEVAGRNLTIHATTRAPLLPSHPGQGPTLGYPRYPDMDNIGERSRFRAFQRRIEAMLEGVPQAVKDEARYRLDAAVESVV